MRVDKSQVILAAQKSKCVFLVKRHCLNASEKYIAADTEFYDKEKVTVLGALLVQFTGSQAPWKCCSSLLLKLCFLIFYINNPLSILTRIPKYLTEKQLLTGNRFSFFFSIWGTLSLKRMNTHYQKAKDLVLAKENILLNIIILSFTLSPK